jgi:hypothetical protein
VLVRGRIAQQGHPDGLRHELASLYLGTML